MSSTRNKRPVIVMAMAGVIITIIVIYGLFDPASHLFPRCPVKMLTGLDCPGCGSQRALHALLHGDIAHAFSLNPLIFILAPYAALVIALEARPGLCPRLRHALTSTAAIITLMVAIIAWTIIRNLCR